MPFGAEAALRAEPVDFDGPRRDRHADPGYVEAWSTRASRGRFRASLGALRPVLLHRGSSSRVRSALGCGREGPRSAMPCAKCVKHLQVALQAASPSTSARPSSNLGYRNDDTKLPDACFPSHQQARLQA